MLSSIFYNIVNSVKMMLFRIFNNGKDVVYYINGSDTLPPPLSAEEEAKVLADIENDQSLKSVLIEHNLRLVVYIAKKFETGTTGVEDLISIGTIGLIKAINTYDSTKNIKLATYASRCIENEILMYMRKTNNQKVECSLDEPLNVDWDGNELLLSDILGTDENSVMENLETEEEIKIVRKAVSNLNDRERMIIDLRFGLSGKEEKTQKEVADMLGISQSYISRLEKKILKRLKKEISYNM